MHKYAAADTYLHALNERVRVLNACIEMSERPSVSREMSVSKSAQIVDANNVNGILPNGDPQFRQLFPVQCGILFRPSACEQRCANGDGPLAMPHIQTRTRRPKDTQWKTVKCNFRICHGVRVLGEHGSFLHPLVFVTFSCCLCSYFCQTFARTNNHLDSFLLYTHIIYIFVLRFVAPFSPSPHTPWLCSPPPSPLQSMRLPKLYVIIGIYNFFCRSLSLQYW